MIGAVPYHTADERRAAHQAVAAHLEAGGVVAYPTETVYGFGCVLDAEPLGALAAFKGERPFLLLIRTPEDAPGLVWTDDARRLTEAFWPGPLTVVLTAGDARYPPQVLGVDGGVAVRVSPHDAIPALLDAAGGPVTSTSANRPGRPPARDAETAAREAEALAEVAGEVTVLDGGRLPAARPSTIVRCGEMTRLIREGEIGRVDLESVVTLQ